MFVDGERRAIGQFVGRRLFSRSPSTPIFVSTSGQQEQQGQSKNSEPLRLGSRGAQDHWRGQLYGIRVWGVASTTADVRWRMANFPSSESLVRAPPPPSYGITVPESQEVFRRLRLHAPLPDPPDGVRDDPTATPARGRGGKAYYEVSPRTVGWGGVEAGWWGSLWFNRVRRHVFPLWYGRVQLLSETCDMVRTFFLGP